MEEVRVTVAQARKLGATVPKRKPVKRGKSPLEVEWAEVYYILHRMSGEFFPLTPQFRFDESRKWALDWAIVERKIGIEVHGGIWTHGRHTRGAGFQGDRRKINAAIEQGWRIVEAAGREMIEESVDQVLRMLAADGVRSRKAKEMALPGMSR